MYISLNTCSNVEIVFYHVWYKKYYAATNSGHQDGKLASL